MSSTYDCDFHFPIGHRHMSLSIQRSRDARKLQTSLISDETSTTGDLEENHLRMPRISLILRDWKKSLVVVVL